MKSKIYSSEYMKSSSKGQRWIPAFAMIAFLLAFPVAELILMGKWNERSYTQSQLSYLYSSLWSSDFLTMGAAVAAVTAFLAAVSGFWYLYSPRKVDFYHSLPVKRSALFLHRVLLAVLYYLVPYVIMEFAAVCIGAARGYYSLSIMKKALILLVLHLLMYLLVYFSTVLVIACTGTMLMGALAWVGLFTYSIVLAVMLQLSGHLFFDTWYEGSYGILAAVRNLGSPLMVIVSFIDRYSSGSFGKQLLILILTLFIMAALSWMDGILQTKVREYRKSSGIYLDGAGLKCPAHNTIRTGDRSDLLYDSGRFIQNSMVDLRNDTGNDPGPWNSGSDL